MKKDLLEQLETPCVVIDMEKTRSNIAQMQRAANALGCDLRPHIKTHKMPLFARMQMEAGAVGITCAKVGEAEVMADAGVRDIFIAYPMVGDFRVRRVIALARRVPRLILGVDSLACALPLSRAAKEAGVELEIWMEVDTGAGRTGVKTAELADLATQLTALDSLKLTGIYTFKSLVHEGRPTTDPETAGAEEGALMAAAAAEIRACGVSVAHVSAGSSPTGLAVAKTGRVSEIRPGTYIFKDYMLFKEGVAQLGEIAVRIVATVVSTPCREYAVIDGGTKTFPMDIVPGTAPYYYPGYAAVADNEDLSLSRMSEEHGMLTSKKGDTGLKVGDKVELIPIHVCPAINLQNQVYLLDKGALSREAVAARGMLV